MTYKPLPYFARNGAILTERVRHDGFSCVRVACPNVTVLYYLDPINPDYRVEVPGNWLHTEEEYETANKLAREAVREWLGANKES